MNLSSMYGVTLPVLLFSLQKEDVIELLKSVDSKFNSFIVEDFKKSLNYMERISEFMQIGRAGTPQLTDVMKRKPIVELTTEEQIPVNNAIKFMIITEIARLEATGHILDSSFELEDFLTKVNCTSFVKARRSVKAALPEYMREMGTPRTFEFLSTYGLEVLAPDELNGITLEELDKKILKFYYLRLVEFSADITNTLNAMSDIDSAAVQVLLRKPRAMYYKVYDSLAPLQDVTTIVVLQKVIADLKTNLEMQSENIANTVKGVSFDAKSVVDKVISTFIKEALNSRFGVEMSVLEWEAQFERMDSLCICGMNWNTDLLYEMAIRDFTPKSGVVSDTNTLREYEEVIADIQAALDSMLSFNAPIG